MRSLLIAAALLLAALCASSQAGDLTAAQLANACAGLAMDGHALVTVEDRQLVSNACYGYMTGFFGGYALGAGYPTLRSDRPICLPPHALTIDAAIDLLRAWLVMHPEQAPWQAFDVLGAALSHAYPCPAAARP